MNKKTIRDVDLTGKRVLVRVDFNVPIENGVVSDITRIEAALPTLLYILNQNPRYVLLMSHLGRPKPQDTEKEKEKFSLKPLLPILREKLGMDHESCWFVERTVSPLVEEIANKLPEGGVMILENTRFNEGETKNDAEFVSQLARLGDVFVNDAFGSAHRAHASTVGITQHMEAVAGFLMEKELDFLINALEEPKRPFVAILGGAKVGDKVKVIEALLEKVDKLLIGGGMGITFLKAQGYEVAGSLVDQASLGVAGALYAANKNKIMLPKDVVIADEFSNDANRKTIDIDAGVPEGWQILDIGPKSIKSFTAILEEAQTVVWNGPVGVFEMPNFAAGTDAITVKLAERTKAGAVTIIGGGDSASAVVNAGYADAMTHISTGGGASLELLEGRELPGVVALTDR